jgi:hypothetical protein
MQVQHAFSVVNRDFIFKFLKRKVKDQRFFEILGLLFKASGALPSGVLCEEFL